MSKFEGVPCIVHESTWYSEVSPNRCVVELPFDGMYAAYEREEDSGVKRGVVDEEGAYDWLNGVPLDDMPFYEVVVK